MGCCAANDVAYGNQYPGNINNFTPGTNDFNTPTPGPHMLQ